jgi:osmotically-inducible protein OsmY
MNRREKKTWRTAWALASAQALGLAFLLIATSVAAKEEQFGSDAWITAKTKIALITTDGVSAMDVNVDTVDGKVTLHGKVDTQQAREKAAAATRKIEGVRDVRNLLQVIEAGRHEETEVDDKAIAKNVDDAIDADKSLEDSDISVQSVNNGVVLLAGHAANLGDHLEALNLASGVPGVRRVASEVTSDNRLYDDGIWHQGAMEQDAEDAAKEAGDAPRSVGETISDAATAVGHASGEAASATGNAVKDAWITAATKTKLVADGDVSAMDVNVDTYNGVVTLFGTVESMQAKTAAEQDARSVSGVRNVKNEIKIAMDDKSDAE